MGSASGRNSPAIFAISGSPYEEGPGARADIPRGPASGTSPPTFLPGLMADAIGPVVLEALGDLAGDAAGAPVLIRVAPGEGDRLRAFLTAETTLPVQGRRRAVSRRRAGLAQSSAQRSARSDLAEPLARSARGDPRPLGAATERTLDDRRTALTARRTTPSRKFRIRNQPFSVGHARPTVRELLELTKRTLSCRSTAASTTRSNSMSATGSSPGASWQESRRRRRGPRRAHHRGRSPQRGPAEPCHSAPASAPSAFLLPLLLLDSASAARRAGNHNFAGGGTAPSAPARSSSFFLVTVLSLVPGLAVMITCFPFIVTVLSDPPGRGWVLQTIPTQHAHRQPCALF